jgi:hypothetical protein
MLCEDHLVFLIRLSQRLREVRDMSGQIEIAAVGELSGG